MLRGTDNHKSEISIHAPTRGATLPILPCRQDNSISIHAPTRGATQSKLMPIADMTLFQSTLPREERHCLIVKTSLYSYFNPRSHERSDGCGNFSFGSDHVFQSTLPREERQSYTMSTKQNIIFQSTLPREERQ